MASTITITPRSVGPIIFDATVEERHEDSMIITEHPVEVGSTISDHAYKMPSELTIIAATSLGSKQNKTKDQTFLRTLYTQLLALQASATLLAVETGKRSYRNMLIKHLGVTTDKTCEFLLSVNVGLQEILLAKTTIVSITPQASQAFPQRTASVINQGPVNTQPAPSFNASQTPPQ